MASSSRNNTTGSTSPSKRHSRVADAVQVAPYLTHVIRHHGQVTLIPPENSGRIRKEKKRRPGLRGVNSNSSPDLPRLLGTRSRPSTPRPTSSSSYIRSQPELDSTPRTSHTRSRSYQNRSQEEDFRIPDFPPPSFEEAMLARPSSNGSTPGSVVAGTQPVVDRTPLDEDAPDLASSSEIGSPRSASSHSSIEDVSVSGHRPLWEEDREAGFSLEERVRRELERRQLSDSLPRAPLMRYSKESAGCEADTGASEADDDASRSQQGSQHAPTRKESPGDVSLSVDSQLSNSSQQASDSVPSTSRGNTGHMDMDTEGAYMGTKCPVSAKGKGNEHTPNEVSTSNESRRRETHRQHHEGPSTMIRQALNAPLHLQIEGPDASSIPSEALPSPLLNTLGQIVSVEQSFESLHSPGDPSSSLVVSSSSCAPISTPKPSAVASHSDIPNNIPPVASPSPSTTSHSAPVLSIVQPNLPLPSSQAPLPATSATVPPLPPRPPLASTVVSVRDRISTFESMRKRPVPPPPPVRPIIRRPPPPVPSSSNSRDSFAARAGGESKSEQSKSDTSPSLPIRRRMPPPVPPRRARKSNESIPPEPIQRLTPSTVISASTAPSSSVPVHSTNGDGIVSPTSQDASDVPVTHTLAERIESPEGRREWSSSVGHTLANVVEDEAAPALSSSVVPATLVPMTASDAAPTEVRDNAVSAEPNNGGAGESTSPVNELEGSQFSPRLALAETSLIDMREIRTPDDTGIVSQGSNVGPENTTNERPGDHDDATFSTIPGQEPTSDNITNSSSTAQPLQPMFTGLTDLDLLLARLDDPDFTFSGRSYDDLLLLEEIMGSATGPSDHLRAKLEDIPLGKVEVLRRRVTKDGRTKLKIALFGVIVDKCGICMVQFKEGVFACLLPCQHANNENMHLFPQEEDRNDEDTEESVADSRCSASTPCGSLRRFNAWAQQHNVIFLEPKWSDKEFTDFMNSRKYPAYINGKEIITSLQGLLSAYKVDRLQTREFNKWRGGLDIEPDDRYLFQIHLQHLTVLWISMLSKIENPENEATYRWPIDAMLELALHVRPGGKLLYRQEMELALPDNPEFIKADGVVTKALPKQWNRFIRSLQRWNFSWTYSREVLSTIALVFEAELDNLSTVLRQLQMDLFSAQSQRRALCMKNGPVFGVILNNGYLRIYVSLWKDDQLVVRPAFDPLHLDSMWCFFEAYFILCRIADFQAQWLENEFKRWDEDEDEDEDKDDEDKDDEDKDDSEGEGIKKESHMDKLMKSNANTWRSEDKKYKRKESSRGGTGDGEDVEGDAEGEPREDLKKVDLDDDQEVQGIRVAVARAPFPEDGYSLTRKRLYVLIKMQNEKQAPRKQLISEWVKRANACAGEYMHMYSPQYVNEFRDDISKFDDGASTTVAVCESNVGALVGDHTRMFDDTVKVEKKNVDASLCDTTTTDEEVIVDEAA